VSLFVVELKAKILANLSADEKFQEGFLRVQPVFGFLENNALWAVNDISRDFLATMSGQTMHE
jgi:hypothetical protein